MDGVKAAIHPTPVDLATFLQDHMIRNIEQAANLLGRSEDDVWVLLYTIINKVFQINPPANTKATLSVRSGTYFIFNIYTECRLFWPQTKVGRPIWEKDFARLVLEPCVQELDATLLEFHEALKVSSSDDNLSVILTQNALTEQDDMNTAGKPQVSLHLAPLI